MTAIARFLVRRISAFDPETGVLTQLALLACAGLLISLLMMTYVVDPGVVFLNRDNAAGEPDGTSPAPTC